MHINDSKCYTNSSLTINLINTHLNNHHKYAMLIQSIKDILFKNTMFKVVHILHECNQSANFMAKLDASSYADLLTHISPPKLNNIGCRNFSLKFIDFFFLFFSFSFVTNRKKVIYLLMLDCRFC